MKLKHLLGQSSFILVNKRLTREINIESALFLSILVDATEVFENEWVYQTTPTIEKLSYGYLTRRKQEKAIKSLEENGLIEHKNMGIPCKRYFKIHEDKVIDLLTK